MAIMLIVFSSIGHSAAQTMYDSWLRSQSSWQMDMGVSLGITTGLQFQYFTPRRNTCKTLNKRIGFDFGIYYEGLIFENFLKQELSNWERGGYRGNISLIYYPDLRIKANRFILGGGIESGTRKFDGTHLFKSDIIAKIGWELSFLPLTGAPVVLRFIVKYDRCFNDDFTYLLPAIGVIYGK